MTPVLLKPCPTDAISDSAENLRKLSALRAEVSGQSGGNDASLLSCFSFRPPQSRGSPRKSARKRLESSLRGRDTAPPRRRPHSGSQGQTWGLFSLFRQFLLYLLALGSSFGKVQMMLDIPLYCFANRTNVVAQVSVFLQSILHNDRRRLHGDETLFYQPGHITFDGALAFANGFTDGCRRAAVHLR